MVESSIFYPTRADVIRNFCVDLRHLCSIDAGEGVVALVEFAVKYATRGYRTPGNADYPHTSFATCTTNFNFAIWSSIVNLLPSTVLEKPHCGLMPS